VPHIQLLTNDWFSRKETNSFLENTCLKGSFKAGYLQARDAAGTETEVSAKVQKAVLGPRDSGRNASQTLTFFIPFEKAVEYTGVASKLYK